jgi:tetratricopeptide (TPR) repeat protein
MAFVEPIIVVLGPFGGGTSAVAKVLHHLGVFMGREFDWTYREPHDTWEDSSLSQLCRLAFSEPGGQLQMDADSLQVKLRTWADDHRRAAGIAGRPPGVKHPLLCVAVDFIRDAWQAVVPVVVDRPLDKTVASLNRLGWWSEQERVDSAEHLVAARDLALAGSHSVRVDFEALRDTPTVAVRRLADELHLNVTDAQVDAAVESILQSADVDRDADPYGLDVLLAKVESNPNDTQSVHFLAQIYFDIGDFANARKWYERQIQMGGFSDEEIYVAMLRVAESMGQLGEPWPKVQDAFLRAWEFRPTRAEALHAIALHCRVNQRYQLGYLFAERAAEIPFPANDMMLSDTAVLAWRAIDEQAICASWIGKHAEAFALCRRLLARSDIPDGDRQRIAVNRDFSVPSMMESASAYPDVLVRNLTADPPDTQVTVSLLAGPDLTATERTLNSFLRCCTDVSRVGRFLILDTGLSTPDRTILQERYRFLEFAPPVGETAPQLAQLRTQIHGRFWLHLGQGWQFFAPENFVTRLAAVLNAEPHVFQVGINFADAVKLTGTSAAEQEVRRTPEAGRYVLTDVIASGPAMFDTARLDRAGNASGSDLRTASLDEVLCVFVGGECVSG